MTERSYIPQVELDGVTKRYEGCAVVDGLTLTSLGGSIHCLLGPNGAGKTTTMDMLMGLRRPSAGDIRIDGVSVRDPEVHSVRRRMGYLADSPDLYEDLTGREFLQFLAELYEVPASLEGMSPVLEAFDLPDEIDRPLAACSAGVRKKIALVGALVPSPAMLILDEPTGNLDAHAARAAKDLMRRMRDERKLVFFSTHIMEVAQQIADTISIIDHGQLIFTGTMAELREQHGQSEVESLEDVFLRLTARRGTSPPSEPVTLQAP